MSLGKLLIDLGANVADFESDMGRAARIAKKQSEKIKKQIGVAMKAVVTSAAAAGTGLTALVKTTANTADEFQKMSIRLGASTEFLSEMRHVAELSGTSVEKVGDGIRKMAKSIYDANNGLSTATRAFETLGISLNEINSLSPEQQFELIAEKISKIESQSTKAGAAMDIFGRSGSELLTVLSEGKAGIAAMREEAESFGLSISQDTADAAAHFNDELTRLKNKALGFAETLGASLLPTFTAVVEEMNSAEIGASAEKFSALNNVIAGLFGALKLVQTAFQVVGTAAGAVAVAVVARWQEAVVKLKRFGNDIKALGLILLDGLPGVDYSQEIEQTIQAGFKLTKKAEEQAKRTQEALDMLVSETGDDVEAAVSKALASILRVMDAANSPIKKTEKHTKKATAALEDFGDTAKKVAKEDLSELKKVFDDFEDVAEQFITPLERLEEEYQRQVEAVEKYIAANENNAEAVAKARKILKLLEQQYKENREEITSALTPYKQLIKSLKEQAQYAGASKDELARLQAVRDLEAAGITRANTSLDEYNAKLREVLGLYKQINGSKLDLKDAQGTNLDAINNFNSNYGAYVQAAMNTAEAIQRVENRGDDGQSDFDAHRAAASERAAAGDYGPWAQLFGQIEQFLQGITGGKLFGTAFAQESATQSFNVGGGGFGGQSSVTQVRQRSWFRGREWRTIVNDLSEEAAAALKALYISVSNTIASTNNLVGGNLEDMIAGEFEQKFDAEGNLVSSISTVLGRTFEESFEEFGQRLLGENIIASLDTVLPQVEQTTTEVRQVLGDFGEVLHSETVEVTRQIGEASAIAERWRDNAATLLDGAKMLSMAVQDSQGGNALFETLTETTNMVERLQNVGESLTDAYSRIFDSVSQLEAALSLSGQSLDMTREAFVRFATDITTAAGGTEQAAALWSSYFDNFYSETELAQQRLADAVTQRNGLLGDLGIDQNIDAASFRQQFESLLPTLSPEQVVQWLQAAEAIAAVTTAEERLEQAREQQTSALSNLMSGISSNLEDMGLSDFASKLKTIASAYAKNIASARELGASEKELAMIQTYAARQIKQAIAELESSIASSLNSLYGSELDQINAQIALAQSQQSGISSVQSASDNLYASQLQAIKNIQKFVKSLTLNENLSTLNPMQQLDEARRQFEEMLAAARGGDVDAMNQLPQLAQTLLGFGRQVWASGEEYTSLFDFVTNSLSGLDVTASQADPQQVIIGQNSQLLALQQRQTELLEQQESAERYRAAMAIAEQLRELSSVTGESFSELAERLGVPVESFLSDLGVSLDNLTVETASQLATVAQTLGVEITDLAQSVGISLGELSDAQSLLNDALEQTINGLPEGIQGTLEPLLRAIETATDPEQREQLLKQMTDFIDTLPQDQRDQLAPYFERIDPTTDAQTQIDKMDALNATSVSIRDEVATLRGQNSSGFNDVSSGLTQVSSNIDDLAYQFKRFLDAQT